MLSDAVFTGIVIVCASALVGIIGVLANTQKHPGLKWALFFLLVAGAVAGIHREYENEAAAKAEKKRADEALKIAAESSRLVENGMLKQEADRVQFTEDREKLEANLKAQRELMETLVGQIVSLSTTLEEMSEAADKARKKDIADMGDAARLDASKTLVILARKENWMEGKQLNKLETSIRKKKPLPAADLQAVQTQMKQKHQETPP